MKTCISALATWSVCRAARWYLETGGQKKLEYLDSVVRIRPLWNRGAAFDLPIRKEALPLVSAGVMLSLLGKKRQYPVAVGLILGGGASNLQERLTEGRVYDYLQFPKAPGLLKKYVYNAADLAIFLGAMAMLREKD